MNGVLPALFPEAKIVFETQEASPAVRLHRFAPQAGSTGARWPSKASATIQLTCSLIFRMKSSKPDGAYGVRFAVTEKSKSQNGKPISDWRSVKSNPLILSAAAALGRTFVRPSVKWWVFCAATGRCGTNTLADLLAFHPDIGARHEPFPQPSHHILAACDRGDARMIADYWKAKAPRIYRAARGFEVYLETTHLFLHSFADCAVREFGERMKVIHLRRDVHETARSFFRRGQDPAGDPWLIRPSGSGVVLDVAAETAPGGPFDDHYLRLVWYCCEVHARTLRFSIDHPEIEVVSMRTADLNDKGAVARLLSALDLEPNVTVLDKCGARSNASATPPEPPAGLDPGRLAAFEALLDEKYRQSGLAEKTGVATLRDPA